MSLLLVNSSTTINHHTGFSLHKSAVTTTALKGGAGGRADVASMIVGSRGSRLHDHARRRTGSVLCGLFVINTWGCPNLKIKRQISDSRKEKGNIRSEWSHLI